MARAQTWERARLMYWKKAGAEHPIGRLNVSNNTANILADTAGLLELELELLELLLHGEGRWGRHKEGVRRRDRRETAKGWRARRNGTKCGVHEKGKRFWVPV
jgi:hypothetical protein